MRHPPNLSEDRIMACLHAYYDLPVASCRFLPIGYDLNAFVYQVLTAEGVAYFVKLRSGAIPPPSLLVPGLLLEHGIPHILAPLRTRTRGLWCALDGYSLMVYPFIRGDNAKIVGLSDRQWRDFGATLKAIHCPEVAARLQGQVPVETFSIPSARLAREVRARLRDSRFESPAAAGLAAYWEAKTPLIEHLLGRAEALGQQLRSRTFEYVLCHADIHGANILVSDEGEIYLIDWDGPLLAPRERDLLFVVGSRIGRPVEAREEALFFEGYGEVPIDLTALAYYRYERAIEDMGEIGQRVCWDTGQSEEAKAYDTACLRSQFHSGKIVESAMQADRDQGSPSLP